MAIQVRVGAEPPRVLALRGALTRVGSHPSCELRLSDAYAPPHLVTLECRDGSAWVHNRSGHVVLVGEVELATEQSRAWEPGEEARLNPWVTLLLGHAAGPRRHAAVAVPAAGPTRGGPGDLAAPHAQEAGPRRSRDGASFALSALLILGTAWVMLVDAGSGDAETDRLAHLVQAIHGGATARPAGDPLKLDVCLRIQAARTAELRGNRPQAGRTYRGVRDTLLSLRHADGRFDDPWFEEAFSFVRGRLQSLN